MAKLLVITHPEVIVDPKVPIPDWGLSDIGRTRAAGFAASDACVGVSHIWSSDERKARDAAEILAAPHGLPVEINAQLGENDRSATGFLPSAEFEAAADAFFAHPKLSFRGWETAVAAQTRVHQAVASIVKSHEGGDLAIVTHGAVGTLLWCALSDRAIDRRYDQPGQGHYWQADLQTLTPETGWLTIG